MHSGDSNSLTKLTYARLEDITWYATGATRSTTEHRPVTFARHQNKRGAHLTMADPSLAAPTPTTRRSYDTPHPNQQPPQTKLTSHPGKTAKAFRRACKQMFTTGITFYYWCGYQSLFPRLYRLLITIILQDHPGSSKQTLRCFLIVDPRACGCDPPRCVSTPPSEKEKPAKGLPSHKSNIASFIASQFNKNTEKVAWDAG